MIKRTMAVCLLMSALGAPLLQADEAPGGVPAPPEAAAAPAAASGEAPAAPPALTEPALVSTDKVSAGDTAWMLTSTALVLMMCVPGLALFYGGMVRKKNVLATLM